jgi:hypothetical protein
VDVGGVLLKQCPLRSGDIRHNLVLRAYFFFLAAFLAGAFLAAFFAVAFFAAAFAMVCPSPFQG